MQEAIERLAAADAIIASTPVYKAGISGLFKSFADLIDNDLLIAKPVILAATGGTARHAMVVDEQLRPLFAFLRAHPDADVAVRRTRGLGLHRPRPAASHGPRPSWPCSLRSGAAARSPTTTGPATSTSSPETRPAPNAAVDRRRLRHRPHAARCRWWPSSSVSSDTTIGPCNADVEDGNGPPPDGGGPFPGSSRGGTITPSVRNERGAFAPQAVGVRNQSRSFACSASLLPPCSGRSAFAFSPAV